MGCDAASEFAHFLAALETATGVKASSSRLERAGPRRRTRRSSNGSVDSSAPWRAPSGMLALMRANYEIDVRRSSAFDPGADPDPASRGRCARSGRSRVDTWRARFREPGTSSCLATTIMLQASRSGRAGPPARSRSRNSSPAGDLARLRARIAAASPPMSVGSAQACPRCAPTGAECHATTPSRSSSAAGRSSPSGEDGAGLAGVVARAEARRRCGARIVERIRGAVHQGGRDASTPRDGVAGGADVSELGPCAAGRRRASRRRSRSLDMAIEIYRRHAEAGAGRQRRRSRPHQRWRRCSVAASARSPRDVRARRRLLDGVVAATTSSA